MRRLFVVREDAIIALLVFTVVVPDVVTILVLAK